MWHFVLNGWLLYITLVRLGGRPGNKADKHVGSAGEPSGAFCHLDHHGNSQIHNQHSCLLQLNMLHPVCVTTGRAFFPML